MCSSHAFKQEFDVLTVSNKEFCIKRTLKICSYEIHSVITEPSNVQGAENFSVFISLAELCSEKIFDLHVSFIHFFKILGLTEPPTPQEFPIPSARGVWIFSGTAHCQ